MIVDSSAIFAVVYAERDSETYAEALEAAATRRISAATYVEIGVVVEHLRDLVASRRLDDFVRAAQLMIEPVTEEQARIARDAYRDYGKASGHPARLNFGDCFSYALAKALDEPLLFKGRDFAQTDIKSALDALLA